MTEEELFTAATQRPISERAPFLEQACGRDATLRTQIEELLEAHDHPDSLLEADFCEVTLEAPTRLSEAEGTIIGPYKLLQQIGEGGMGIVYMAEQHEPVRRKVALKVVKPGMETRQVVARFEAERQALALMDHPNIARVIDGGTTDSHRPYFVMELVRGVPITEYCNKKKLNARQRLELFVTVCRAVQHAHQRAIIHRDLKPTNILVTQIDAAPVVKVIDFGIAKTLGERLTDKTLFTQFSQMIGTPLYMSPEQAEMTGNDIDTRTDVYSLGVLLYELIAGDTPLNKQMLEQVGHDDMRRMIREVEPPKPSDRISTLNAEQLSTVSGQLGFDARKYAHSLKGELDWIVMRALEKDRTRRYASAAAFADDIERYLRHDAVKACPPSKVYRLKKFVRRNKAALITTSLVSLALIVGTVVSVWQAVEANTARQVADERLVLANRRLAREEQARTEADEQRKIAEANFQLAQQHHSAGIEQLRDSIQTQREWAAALQQTAPYQSLMYSIDNLAQVFEKRDFDQADQFLAEAEVLGESILMTSNRQPHGEREVSSELALALILIRRAGIRDGRLEYTAEQESFLRRAIALLSRHVADDPDLPRLKSQWVTAHVQLGKLLAATDRFDEANRVYQTSHQFLLKHPAADLSVATAAIRNGRTFVLVKLGRLDEVLDVWNEQIELEPRTSFHRKRRANVYFMLGRFTDALEDLATAVELNPFDTTNLTWISPSAVAACPSEAFRAEILALADKTIDRMNDHILAYFRRGALHAAMRQFDAAQRDFQSALALAGRANDEGEPKVTMNPDNYLAWGLTTNVQADFNEPRATELAEFAVASVPSACQFWNALGVARYRDSDWAGAQTAMEKSMDLNSGGTSVDWFFLAMSLWQLDQKDEAYTWYYKAVDWMEKHSPRNKALHRFRNEAAALLRVHEEKAMQPQ